MGITVCGSDVFLSVFLCMCVFMWFCFSGKKIGLQRPGKVQKVVDMHMCAFCHLQESCMLKHVHLM